MPRPSNFVMPGLHCGEWGDLESRETVGCLIWNSEEESGSRLPELRLVASRSGMGQRSYPYYIQHYYIQHYIQLFNFWITVGRCPTLTRLSQRLTLRGASCRSEGDARAGRTS